MAGLWLWQARDHGAADARHAIEEGEVEGEGEGEGVWVYISKSLIYLLPLSILYKRNNQPKNMFGITDKKQAVCTSFEI